ncbi:MAG: ACT domain-containing protein, partial [Actinomycetota bacterium]
GLLRSSEREAVDAAEEFLVRARSAVHLLTAREAGRDTGRATTRQGPRSDRLVMELQPEVAEGMGFTDRPRLTATDGLMRTLFEHARNVEHIRSSVLDRVLTHNSAGPAPSLDGPAEVLVALAEVAEETNGDRGVPTPRLLDAVEAAGLPDPVAWTPEVREAFLRLLRAGERGIRMLDALDRLGLLSRYLTSWAAVRCRPQRDPYHRYTVEMHLLTTVAGMGSVLGGGADTEHGAGGADDPLQAEAVNMVDHPDGALLGALLHDIGKVGAGAHVPAGAAIAHDQLDAMSLERADRDLAAFMVAEHLLLPDTATRRDLTDENLILDVAARVGTPERLAALYLLAKADARATGPAAWTPWRQALVRELVSKVQRAFERGEMGEELAATLTERVDRIRALLTAEPSADVDRFVLRMPRGYFLSVEPAQAARHFGAIVPQLGTHEVRATAVPGRRQGTYELLVVAADRPGLLSLIAGALSIGGISILSAQVFTTEDGTAVDLFEVEGAFEPVIVEGRWRDLRSTLRRALEGSTSLERRVQEKRSHYPSRGAVTAVTVHVDNEASDFSTVIEVGASDRIGLLHDITRTFADLQLDVHLAKVATYDGRVVDAFYVRDAFGRKLIDPVQLGEIEAALRERLT